MAKIFHILVSPDDARSVLASQLRRVVHQESRDISEASGYISAEDIYSTEDVPPFDRSEVDGYAVDHGSLSGAEEDSPRELEIVGEIEIGKKPEIEIKNGKTAYISTGSMVPRGADSIVMVEYTSKRGNRVRVFRSVSPGENIAHAGSDFFMSEPILRRGSLITPESVSLLASSGIDKILVYKKLRVGILSTGNELVNPGQHLKVGEIFDSNSYYFKASLEETGFAACSLLGTLPDDETRMEKFIKSNIDRYEALVSSGSTSAGFHDLLYRIIEDLGGKMLFHGISVKPGKPTFAASFGKSVFLGMPGFPLSAGSVLKYIVIPSLRGAYNANQEPKILISLPFRINSEKGKDLILPAIISRSGRAYPIFGESGSISRLSYADGFIAIDNTKNYYDRDDKVPFFPFNNKKRDVLFIGSNDPLFERVLFDASNSPTVINAGSWGGVEAIKLGEADVTGVHLLKGKQYNTFLLQERGSDEWVLVRGFSRTQGMISRDGIKSFSQVVSKDMIFVNRNKGSGTRDLIESEIERELGSRFAKEKIRGYFWEAKSHAAVAKAIHQGRGDVGVSIEFYATILDLKFHKIRDENYDLIMQKDFYSSSQGRKLISKLKESTRYSKEFPGYRFPKNIGEILS
ncbi:MAG: molybdopterin biosynthesis protein [Candidatus Thermoplasmatota archaeon]|jgi:molybdenum cofactor synthesis domain-containing protein|nr:molybdopterin biosynthesis protein [Candidatus Thermoplasmatota archaeon]